MINIASLHYFVLFLLCVNISLLKIEKYLIDFVRHPKYDLNMNESIVSRYLIGVVLWLSLIVVVVGLITIYSLIIVVPLWVITFVLVIIVILLPSMLFNLRKQVL